jgi:hypothetical protein
MSGAERDATRGGVLVRARRQAGERLVFVPAAVAREVTALSALTRVPGLEPPALGVALAAGRVVTVLDVGAGAEARADEVEAPAACAPSPSPSHDEWPMPGCDRAVLCDLAGDVVALSGGEIVATGLFEAAPSGDGIHWRGADVAPLDVGALYAQAESAIWAARAARPRGGSP